MVTAVWQHELSRFDSLFATLGTGAARGPITVEWNPYLHDLWPRAERSWGQRLDADWVYQLTFGYRGIAPVIVVPHGGQLVRWDVGESRWVVEVK
jgi:hypothetical protein